MKRSASYILSGVIILVGLFFLAISLFALPVAIRAELAGDFDYLPILIAMSASTVPLFVTLFQAHKLMALIRKNKAFSEASVCAVRRIKNCSLVIAGIYTLGSPYVFYVADRDDAPGVFAVTLLFIAAALVIAAGAAVMQRLLQNAVALKKENDLTV